MTDAHDELARQNAQRALDQIAIHDAECSDKYGKLYERLDKTKDSLHKIELTQKDILSDQKVIKVSTGTNRWLLGSILLAIIGLAIRIIFWGVT